MPAPKPAPRSRGRRNNISASQSTCNVYRPRVVPPAPKTRQYLSLCEITAEFGGSTWTWRHRALRGVLPSVKLGGKKSKILIPRKAVEDFFQRGYRPELTGSD